eukprot:752200-Hanusia_phi.AAC.5
MERKGSRGDGGQEVAEEQYGGCGPEKGRRLPRLGNQASKRSYIPDLTARTTYLYDILLPNSEQ